MKIGFLLSLVMIFSDFVKLGTDLIAESITVISLITTKLIHYY